MYLGTILAFWALATPAVLANPLARHIRSDAVRKASITSRTDDIKSEYDYVIAGGGTSGLTVADRLTESGEYTVLVIEYGPFDDSDGVYALAGGRQGFIPERLYNITCAPQTSLNNRTFGVSIGKMVGGSSGVNGMVVTRGTTEDYDRWDALWGGNSGWSWVNMLPYFKKAFIFTPPPEKLAAEFSISYDIPAAWEPSPRTGIYATFPTFQFPGTKLLLEAFRAMSGVIFPKDGAAGTHGVFWFPNAAHPTNVTRSFAKSRHWEGLNRPNYQLITRSKVTKVTFSGNVADGLEFTDSSGQKMSVKARKEVILALGSVHTPQVLQSSGIGPQKLLKAAKIPVKVDLPGVGQNFHDHPLVTMPAEFGGLDILDLNLDDLTNNATFMKWTAEVWAANKTGPNSLAGGNAVALLGFPLVSPDKYEAILTKYDRQTAEEYLATGTHPDVVAGYKAQKKLHSESLRGNTTSIYQLYLNGFGNGIGVTMMQQFSRGSIDINVEDPINSEPVVDYRSFSNPADMEIMIELLKFTAKYYLGSPVLAPLKPKINSPYVNDSEIEAWVRNNVRPMEAHPIGTCSMLPRDLGGVIDKNLLVYGVEKLRVIDASMIPMHVGAAIMSTVYAVAEKAADLIKASA